MKSLAQLIRRWSATATAIALCGCTSIDPSGLASLPGDVIGIGGGIRSLGRRPSSVGDVMGRVATVMAIVATVKKYADLNAAQRARVEAVVARRYEQRLAQEKRALSSKYASRRAQVRQKNQTRVAQVRQTSPSQAQRLEKEAEKELAEVDAEWRDAAAENVRSKYGTDYAVPMTNTGGKPVVAFASVKDGDVKVASSAYEVEGRVASGSTVKHSGREYAVVDDQVRF